MNERPRVELPEQSKSEVGWTILCCVTDEIEPGKIHTDDEIKAVAATFCVMRAARNEFPLTIHGKWLSDTKETGIFVLFGTSPADKESTKNAVDELLRVLTYALGQNCMESFVGGQNFNMKRGVGQRPPGISLN
ncbi:MAG TPA: hypothetical protein VMH91_01305 [Candidatus Paceibacterota bacterium]|nr:hypothetical protein [Candidatus Paceibacterota bacterium]